MPFDSGRDGDFSPVNHLRRTGQYACVLERLRDADPPTFLIKSRVLIEACDPAGALRYADRKVLNALLGWRKKHPHFSDAGWTFASTARIREAIGQPGEEGNAGLRLALERLSANPVDLTFDGDRPVRAPLLAAVELPRGDGMVAYRLPELVAEDAERPKAFARLSLEACARLGSRYALVLYELCELLARRDHPRVTLDLDELRARFGTGSAYRGGAAFCRDVLAPAAAAVTDRTTLSATITPQLSRRRRVTAARIEVGRRT